MEFERLQPGQAKLNAENENAIRAAVEGLLNASGANAMVGPEGTHYRDARRPSRPIARYRVTTAAAAPDTVLVKRFDGTKDSGTEIPVRVHFLREVGAVLYAFKPTGGTDAIYAGKPVQLEELWTPPRLQYDGMVMTQEGGQWVGAFTQAPALPTL